MLKPLVFWSPLSIGHRLRDNRQRNCYGGAKAVRFEKSCFMLYRHFCLLLLLPGVGAAAQERAGGWPYYGQNAGGARYTTLDNINVGNVGRLGLAWTYRTGELKKYEGNNAIERATFETTPILIGGVLYLSTASDRVIALDGATGKERWVYDPMVDLREIGRASCRERV